MLLWLNPTGRTDEEVLAWLRERVPTGHTGSATRIAHFAVLTEPPSVDAGELSDKGSINQSIALRRRRADIERLYASGPGVEVLR